MATTLRSRLYGFPKQSSKSSNFLRCKAQEWCKEERWGGSNAGAVPLALQVLPLACPFQLQCACSPGHWSFLNLNRKWNLNPELNRVFGWHRQSRKVWREQCWGSVMLSFAILLQLQSAWSSWLCGFLNPYPKWGPNPKGSSKVRLFLRQLYVACGWRFWRRNFLMEQYWATAMLHLAFLL